MKARESIVEEIRKLNAETRVANFYARIILGPDELEDEGIDVQPATAVTGGCFPLLWLNITFDPARLDPSRLNQIEEQHSLVLIATAQSRVSYF